MWSVSMVMTTLLRLSLSEQWRQESAIRDVGRALPIPYATVDVIAKARSNGA